VKVACPISSYQIRQSIVDFHLKWDGQAHGAQGDSDCLYRRTIFEAHSFFWCFAAGVDVLQSRAVVYIFCEGKACAWGWEAFMADGRPPALIEALRNRACFPLGPQ
jgi:hypothetical protein